MSAPGSHHAISAGYLTPPCWQRSVHQPQHRPAEGRRHLINVSGKLRLYCYSKKMAPFISAPSAQAHLLLPRQPTHTQQVCNSPPLGVLSSRGCSGTQGAHSSSGSRRSAGLQEELGHLMKASPNHPPPAVGNVAHATFCPLDSDHF